MKRRDYLTAALLGAVLCLLGPFSLPMGPIPLSLATLGVYLAAGLLGPRRGCAAVGLYLLLGALGLPVFAGFAGGIQRLLGPTGGFLLGYLLCALLSGWLVARCKQPWGVPLALGVSTLALYAVGTLWFSLQTQGSVGAALLLCVVPFLVGDGVKIAVATAVILPLRKKIRRLEERRHTD